MTHFRLESIHYEWKGRVMSKLHTLLLCPALVSGLMLASPVTAQTGVTPGSFADESASRAVGLGMADRQNQNATQHQELENKNTATSADRQSASQSNPSASAIERKDKQEKKKDKGKGNAKPESSDQEEQFNKVLLGIYG
jgi:poly(A) polymerase Pap1